jgi:5-formyltetrahydrofolate cyclo-ligase
MTAPDEDAPSALDLDPEVRLELARRAKDMLRKRMRSQRKSLSAAAAAERSRAIADRLSALPFLQRAKAVALYAPIAGRNEVDVTSLDASIRERGGVVYYPSVDPATREMTFRDPGALGGLRDLGQGFPEPEPTTPAAPELDVIVVPALWVDPEGRRIGYGGGFYDRTLPRFRPHSVAVAVVFHFQVGAELPEVPGDERVDWIVTDETALTP